MQEEGPREEDSETSSMAKLSASEKEKTKLRERQRRAITTKIFAGLRKYGGYNLPPRADINDVLKALAAEAGWTVEADGNTYRSQGLPQPSSSHQHSLRQQGPSGSRLTILPTGGNLQTGFNCTLAGIMTDGGDLRDGNCSTTASPRHMGAGQHSNSSSMTLMHPSSGCISNSPFASPASSEGAPSVRLTGNPFVGGLSGGFLPCGQAASDGRDRDSSGVKDDPGAAAYFSADTLDARDFGGGRGTLDPRDFVGRGDFGGRPALDTRDFAGRASINHINSLFFNASQQTQGRFGQRAPMPSLMMLSAGHPFLQEQRASNENTPLGSPQPHGGTG